MEKHSIHHIYSQSLCFETDDAKVSQCTQFVSPRENIKKTYINNNEMFYASGSRLMSFLCSTRIIF